MTDLVTIKKAIDMRVDNMIDAAEHADTRRMAAGAVERLCNDLNTMLWEMMQCRLIDLDTYSLADKYAFAETSRAWNAVAGRSF